MEKIKELVLSVRNICKRYGGIQALKDVSIDFARGETHALIGENGAGKSTLIKMISGAEIPDSGELIFEGKSYAKMNPQLSKSVGVATIYQEFNLFPNLTVAENIYMGDELLSEKKKYVYNAKKYIAQATEVLKKMKVNIRATELIENMTTAQMQLVEIAKAVAKDAKILIMDEPTAPLSTRETEDLFELIERLKADGVTIIYISHRMEEIYRIADRLTIMRDGQYILTSSPAEISRQELICQMANRKVEEVAFQHTWKTGDIVLEAKNISGNGLNNISFTLRAGEILGLGGLLGAGRTELARLLFGAERMEGGELYLEGRPITVRSPKEAVQQGIAYVPEDRKIHGAILSLPIGWNITMPILKRISRHLFINQKLEKNMVGEQRKALRMKIGSAADNVSTLSGGNQQKVVLAKWIVSDPKVLILDEPTRGVDVGAKQEIYNLIADFAKRGLAIILISSDMDELLNISDRLIVLNEKQIVGRLEKNEFSQNKVLAMASGIL